jgi:hypothetical protein
VSHVAVNHRELRVKAEDSLAQHYDSLAWHGTCQNRSRPLIWVLYLEHGGKASHGTERVLDDGWREARSVYFLLRKLGRSQALCNDALAADQQDFYFDVRLRAEMVIQVVIPT